MKPGIAWWLILLFIQTEERRLFDRFISDKGLKVTGQINTHCHVDHVLGVQHMQSTYG